MTSPQPQAGSPEPPLWAPYYGAPFTAAFARFWRKYAVFNGRASRSEYWWWQLITGVVALVLSIISTSVAASGMTMGADGTPEPGPGFAPFMIILGIWAIATVIPNLAVLVRRLHDANLSGWLVLLGIVPIIGGIAVLVFTLLPSQPAGQRYDRPPQPEYVH